VKLPTTTGGRPRALERRKNHGTQRFSKRQDWSIRYCPDSGAFPANDGHADRAKPCDELSVGDHWAFHLTRCRGATPQHKYRQRQVVGQGNSSPRPVNAQATHGRGRGRSPGPAQASRGSESAGQRSHPKSKLHRCGAVRAEKSASVGDPPPSLLKSCDASCVSAASPPESHQVREGREP